MSNATTDTPTTDDTIRDLSSSFIVQSDGPHFETVARFLCEDFVGLKQLCDVRLRFDTEFLPVHSVIIAAHSPVLSGKFSTANKCYELDMSFLKKQSVLHVLQFLYHGSTIYRLDTLHDDLDAISYFGVVKLQEEIEKKLIEIARQDKCVEVLNIATANLKTIPHSLSTMLAVSDETVCDLVNILHEKFVNNRMPFEHILKLSTNTVITMLSSRIADVNKVEIINMALKWIYERRLNDQKASSILSVLTFGSLTYTKLVNFRNSLIQTAVPVTVGRCVRLKHQDNDLLDLVFLYGEHSNIHSMPQKTPINRSSAFPADTTNRVSTTNQITCSNRASSQPSSQTILEKAAPSSSATIDIDDCTTAVSFTADDMKRFGFHKSQNQ